MDNLTHTLIGVLVGETAAQTTSPTQGGLPQQQRRNLFVTLMGIGSNLPDLDFLQSAIHGTKLAYLLQHRGHTHTVIGALIAAALMVLICEAWCRWQKWTLSRTDRIQIAALCVLALLLHISMDFTNNYGVHPFWPFYNGWLYGDSVFIWEPFLWAAAAPLVLLLRTTVARVLVAALLATAVAVSFGSGLVPLGFSIALAALMGIMLTIGRQAAPRMALGCGIAVWLAVTGVFAVSRSVANEQVTAFIATDLPGMTALDRVLTPMPANPVCWDVMLPLIDGDRYVIRHAAWSIAPSLIAAERCPGHHLFKDISAPVTAVKDSNAPFVFWHGEVVMPRTQIATLAAGNCEAAAFMRFARVPWAEQRDHGWIVGDLRYDREPDPGFAELELSEPSNCPSHVPPWIPPREDLLNAADPHPR